MTEGEFAAFYKAHARSLWSYVYRTTGNSADADDIVQEAFLRVMRSAAATLAEDDLRPYIFRVATNLIADLWNKSTRERTALSTLEAEPASPDVLRSDMVGIFKMLNPRERALLWLAYVEGHDHRSISRALGIAHGSVKVLLSRARSRVRALINSKSAK